MDRPKIKLRYITPKHCTICKREVYHTIHTASSYWVDWYGTNEKLICVDCYKK